MNMNILKTKSISYRNKFVFSQITLTSPIDVAQLLIMISAACSRLSWIRESLQQFCSKKCLLCRHRAVIQSNSQLFRSDVEFAGFEPWEISPSTAIQWSVPTPPDAAELAALDEAWRGRGLTVERMVLDLHSGRIFDMPGVLFMDLVALCMIVLGLSGLLLSNSRYRRQNGAKGANQD